MGSEIENVEARNIKINRYVLIDNEACKVIAIDHSKPGKHGEAKYRIEGIGIFDDRRRSFIVPASHKVEAPMVDKNTAQVLNATKDTIQLMDMKTFEVFEVPKPKDMEIQSNTEISYISAVGKRKIVQKQ
ncbi:MAG: translation initiation factor IF-5A [Candidatus Altiarchaeum hamiconexum]|uniref:Translation initiation factor IF-5A n=1 Tax=Candidatus Altarchaeum hamiconexum TaxID=1803513 RepID=A0A8J8CFL6_9ARCH|nr:translation initiation factor IF-5A [Candidatus Altarchaeum hamiconexum]OIQ06048.1 MAG: translation initiation factor IF-5A [Candidatus Altarchaeum sp. CG2_30_32_3053]PIN66958.1 MAG: translation initiation factor IF-5A [Candidatus Altarchaeum sp. CG12_big_fil_rev_8_21_14_0_65_33_22]PIV28164.1 MAG: translation initiation factor IF-5A [Candidatus Altarchaeum sp. CG03_land_8_20_14_0_80_32_618]PIX48850.1 MAG: translation initiation factor IF-5A [Candidatus Altarchaeum sp. CG_4_8_14_3_um_filter_3